jgi:hypothetical protein
MRVGVLGCAILVRVGMAVLGGVEIASAGSCGGSVACQCGDVVASDYAMTHDLGPCPGHGLVVRSNVTLDCRGFGLVGLGNGSEQYGVYLNGDTGTEVRGARVLRCDISASCAVSACARPRATRCSTTCSTTMATSTRHVGYGLDLAAGARNNLLRGNLITSNGTRASTSGQGRVTTTSSTTSCSTTIASRSICSPPTAIA